MLDEDDGVASMDHMTVVMQENGIKSSIHDTVRSLPFCDYIALTHAESFTHFLSF